MGDESVRKGFSPAQAPNFASRIERNASGGDFRFEVRVRFQSIRLPKGIETFLDDTGN